MKISAVTIRRFRVFDKAVRIPLKSLTVVTGPNNLGKSTVLSALELFFNVIQSKTRLYRDRTYNNDVDYPKRYEGKAGRRWPTRVNVNFELSDDDRSAIMSVEGAGSLPNDIEVQVEYVFSERFGRYTAEVSSSIENKEQEQLFLEWMQFNVRFVYIPAARNVEDFRRTVFRELFAGAINRVSQSAKKIHVIEKFYEDVLGEMEAVAAAVVEELRLYIPNVRTMRFAFSEIELEKLVSVVDVDIDDGASTSLSQKGDGFKSLFSMSMLQYLAKQRYGKNLIFGIEEPEAHLHSSATYQIKETLRTLAERFQVVLTTHSPILIQRDEISANVIVELDGGDQFASTARVAGNLAEVRRSLGIRAQENMITADVVVVVEGATEERVLPVLLATFGKELEGAIGAGGVRVLSAHSAANISAVVRALARDATNCIVLVDSDHEGRKSAERIRSSGLMSPADVFTVPSRDGCAETEFEDLFSPELYVGPVFEAIGIAIELTEFERFRRCSGTRKNRQAKWSEVMRRIAAQHGKEWDSLADIAKKSFAEAIVASKTQLTADETKWVKSIGLQVLRYLKEERRGR